ncbi:MAG: diguanylate cyclase (GGDEF)-like protein [Acidimicrobiales bacterium]
MPDQSAIPNAALATDVLTPSESGPHLELPFDPPLSPVIDLEPLIGLAPGRRSDSAIDGIAVSTVNPETGRAHIVYVSENLAALLGFRPDQLLGRGPEALFALETPAVQLDAVAELVEEGKQAVVKLGLAHISGATISVQASFLELPSLADGWPYFLAVYRDLSTGESEDQLLADQSAMLEALASGHHINDVLSQVAARVEHQVEGGSCWVALADGTGLLEPVITSGQSAELVDEVLANLTHSGHWSTPSYVRAADLPDALALKLRVQQIESLWIYPIAGPGYERRGLLAVAHASRPGPSSTEERVLAHLSRVVAVAVDRNVAESSLAHQALHDPLTQLPNRALIVDRLEQAVARLGRDPNRLAVLLVDVDRFKSLNDSWGAEVGDEVLIEVSRRLRRSVRLGDTVGRIGGDQFLVLCVANGDGEAEAMAERVVSAAGAPVAVMSGEELHITASVGVVVLTESGQSPASIISSAESALASAVDGGRSRYAVFEKGLQQQVIVRHEVEQALHVAITEDELVVHYQPVVEVATGRMVGAEALIRWDRPGHGLLPPADFIEIAEDTGLIVPLGAWVIDDVCRRLAAWPVGADGARPVISVNLSARQLADSTLVQTIVASLERHGVSTDWLGFEVTESMRVEDVEAASATLRRLAALGCKLSIDDFGIGYATLDYLRRFSMADTIKIDRSFVDGLGASREDTAIVTASLALASSLGLSVVAEGVETVSQYAHLADLGCEFAQGYLLSRPVPLEDVYELWARRQLILPPSTVG